MGLPLHALSTYARGSQSPVEYTDPMFHHAIDQICAIQKGMSLVDFTGLELEWQLILRRNQ